MLKIKSEEKGDEKERYNIYKTLIKLLSQKILNKVKDKSNLSKKLSANMKISNLINLYLFSSLYFYLLRLETKC